MGGRNLCPLPQLSSGVGSVVLENVEGKMRGRAVMVQTPQLGSERKERCPRKHRHLPKSIL